MLRTLSGQKNGHAHFWDKNRTKKWPQEFAQKTPKIDKNFRKCYKASPTLVERWEQTLGERLYVFTTLVERSDASHMKTNNYLQIQTVLGE